MNGYNLREKITIIILLILASPFILFAYILFVLIYLVIAPIEKIIYKRTFYYQDIKDKYYLLITLNQKIKSYNKIIKLGKNSLLNGEKIVTYDNFIVHYYNDKNLKIFNDKIVLKEDNDYINLIVINKKLLTNEQFKIINKQSNVIVYDE